MNFKLNITTLRREFFSGEVEKLIIPTYTGQMEIMYHTFPLVTNITSGVIKIYQNGRWMEAATSEGFIRVAKDKVTILGLAMAWPYENNGEKETDDLMNKTDEKKKTDSLREYKMAKAQLAATLAKLKITTKQ